MQLNKNLIIILTIALPLSLIMLVARELEAAANQSELLLMPKPLSDQRPVDANQSDTAHEQGNHLESGLNSAALDWERDILGEVGLFETTAITADLHITKTNVGGSAVAGSTHVYNLTVKNHGPFSSTSSTINDTLPAGWTFSSASGGSCSSATGGFTCTVHPLNAGATQSFNATVNVPAGASAGQATNTATISGNEDPNSGNDTSSVMTTVTVSADQRLSKTGVGSTAVAGSTHHYILTVTNDGPSNSSGGTISDNLPAGWTFVSATGGSCSPVSGGFTCTVNPLAVGTSQAFNATVNVPANAQAGTIVTNTATISVNNDPIPGNNTSSANTTITTSADLGISKQGQPDPVIAGERLTYTLAIHNNGPSIATGVGVTDDLPSGVNLVSAIATAGTCGVTDPVTCTIGTMNVNANVTATIAVDVGPFTSGVLTNSATVAGQQVDENLANNVAIRQTGVNRLGQLLISIFDNPDAVAAGTNLAYTIFITNSGPSGATNVTMTDTLPSEVDFVSANTAPGDTCNESLGVLNCSFGNLAANESASVVIIVFVRPSNFFIQIANQAVVSGNAISPSMAVETTDVEPRADLELTKMDFQDPVTAGENLTYILTVENNGPADAQGVVINDTLPGGVTYLSGSSGCSAVGLIVTCNLGTMTVGQIVASTITVKVNQNTSGSIANTATVLTQSSDPDSSNNTDVEMTTVETKADLAIAKSGTPGVVPIGGTVNYTIDIDNNGPSRATNVRVVDNLPSGVTLISASPGCSGTSIVNCNLGNLNANGDAKITLVVRLDSVTPGSLVNTANVTSDTTDPVNNNNSATSTTSVFNPMIRLYVPIFERERSFNNSCESAALLALNTIYNFLPENRDDWYQFDLPSNGDLVVQLSNFVPQDGQLTVYRGPNCGSRTLIGINGSSATSKVLDLHTQPAGHYYIYVSNDADPSTTPYFLQVIFTP